MYKVSSADRNRIVHLYTVQEWTLKEIAIEYPFSARVVKRVLREEGVQLRKPTLRPEKRRKHRNDLWEQAGTIVALYLDEKKSPRQIAAQFGCSTQPILDILKAKGVEMRSLKESRRYRPDKYGYAEHQKETVHREAGRKPVEVNRKMSVRELRDADLTIDQISEITSMSRVDIFQELQP